MAVNRLKTRDVINAIKEITVADTKNLIFKLGVEINVLDDIAELILMGRIKRYILCRNGLIMILKPPGRS